MSNKEIFSFSINNEDSSNKKRVFIINGKGGIGKDTFVEMVKKYVLADNCSSIDEIRYIAEQLGWTGGKSNRDRKFLSDLKLLSSEYNNMPYQYLINRISHFYHSMYDDNDLLFLHIREPEEIYKVLDFCYSRDIDVNTILVKNSLCADTFYGNEADDNVNMIEYDYEVDNCGTLEDLELEAKKFLNLFNIRFKER